MALNELFQSPQLSWLSTSGQDSDAVLFSRVSLSRNFSRLPFPSRADFNQLGLAAKWIADLKPALETTMGQAFDVAQIEKLSPVERNVLVDKHLISASLIKNPSSRLAMISDDRRISVMANGDDHLCLAAMVDGLNLDMPLDIASGLDDLFEQRLDIAFDEKMGYLTSQITNLGTGLKATVMMHLPGLVLTQNINNIIDVAGQLGMTVRGWADESKEIVGNLFQISNQITLGFTEAELIINLKSAVSEIAAHERRARKALMLHMRDKLEDDVWRAYGVLRFARSLDEVECLSLLSKVRLGIDLKLIDEVTADCFPEIVIGCRTSYLQECAKNDNISQNETNKLRAQTVRRLLRAHHIERTPYA